MQMIAGCTGQQFNERKRRHGAFWEDRYHATAIESGEHLARCVVYVDLNMVRAGVVTHPAQWKTSGYHEIQKPPRRFAIVDRKALAEVLEIPPAELAARHAEWITAALLDASRRRMPQWSTSIAVGSREFVRAIQGDLRSRANGREVRAFDESSDTFVLRDPAAIYRFRH
jgi:putative transposase